MNLSQFETVVRETVGGLPDWVQNALDNLENLGQFALYLSVLFGVA